MSSSINVYAVPIERLEQAVGSGDRSLVDAIVRDQEFFLSTIDDIDDEAETTCAQAVSDLIAGAPSEDVPGYLYGYALEAICAQLGQELTNICPIAKATRWIECVDAVLERNRVPERLTDLVFGGSPVPIPEPDDCPCIGRWSASQVTEALAVLRSLDGSDLDPEMAQTFDSIRAWLEAAAQTPGAAVVGFLS